MLIRAFFWIARGLPLPVLHALGTALGEVILHLARGQRRFARRNIALCLPHLPAREQTRLLRASFHHYGRTLMEYPLIWTGNARRVQRLAVEVRGQELLEHALAQGHGLVLAAMHLGSFEAGIIPMSEHYPMTGVYKPTGHATLDALSCQGRTRFGGRMVAIRKRTAGKGRVISSDLLRALKRGETIYALPDRDPPRGQGVFAPYFGISAHSPTMIPKLIQATGARLLICVGERLPGGRGFVMHFREPPAGYDDSDLETAVAAINAGLEACVRAFPEQYWWGHKRFMRRPPGAPDLYA